MDHEVDADYLVYASCSSVVAAPDIALTVCVTDATLDKLSDARK